MEEIRRGGGERRRFFITPNETPSRTPKNTLTMCREFTKTQGDLVARFGGANRDKGAGPGRLVGVDFSRSAVFTLEA